MCKLIKTLNPKTQGVFNHSIEDLFGASAYQGAQDRLYFPEVLTLYSISVRRPVNCRKGPLGVGFSLFKKPNRRRSQGVTFVLALFLEEAKSPRAASAKASY